MLSIKPKNIILLGMFNTAKHFYIATLYLVLFLFYIITVFLSFVLIIVNIIKTRFVPSKKDVFIGLEDVAFQSQDIASCLKEMGYDSSIFFIPKPHSGISLYDLKASFLTMPFVNSKIPYISFFLTKLYLCFYFMKFFLLYDNFVLLYKETFLPLSIDCCLLKLSGKNVCRCFFGDDIRYRPIQFKIDAFLLGNPPWIRSHSRSSNFEFLRCFFTLYILKIFNVKYSGDYNTCTFSQSPFYKVFVLVNRDVTDVKKTNDIPFILFCPSRPEDKNADFVIKCMNDLKKRKNLKFQFVFLTGVSNQTVLQNLKKADIVIDQPATTIARFSAEGLAYKCCVVTNFKKPFVSYDIFPPIIDYGWDEELFKNNLTSIIIDKERRESLMEEAYKYYQENHSLISCTKVFKNMFFGGNKYFKIIVPEYKEILLKASENIFQKIIIKLFFNY